MSNSDGNNNPSAFEESLDPYTREIESHLESVTELLAGGEGPEDEVRLEELMQFRLRELVEAGIL